MHEIISNLPTFCMMIFVMFTYLSKALRGWEWINDIIYTFYRMYLFIHAAININ